MELDAPLACSTSPHQCVVMFFSVSLFFSPRIIAAAAEW